MTTPKQTAVAHYYKRFRRHQLNTYGSNGLHRDGVDQRQSTGGPAEYGFHAVSAYNEARNHAHFVRDLSETVSRNKKRGTAARRGWKTRRRTAS